MRIAIDTKILAYAEGIGDVAHRDTTLHLLDRLPPGTVMLPVQVLSELFRVLTGKAKLPPDTARAIVQQWAESFDVADSTGAPFSRRSTLPSITVSAYGMLLSWRLPPKTAAGCCLPKICIMVSPGEE